MAQVILEDIYKSFPARKGDTTASASMADPSLTSLSAPPPSAKKGSATSLQPQKTDQLVQVLRRINLDIDDGEFMVLVGPSGCGKSTLLRLIAGLDTPTGGYIKVGDRQVNNLPPKARDIAMVFQSYALYPHMTVYDNLAFGLRRTSFRSFADQATDSSNFAVKVLEKGLMTATRWLPKSLRYQSHEERAIAQHVKTVAEMLQIEGLLNRYPKQLSGGQKQRVALGRAMARNPQVFLMDEPLSNLDAKLRAQTRAQIVKLQRQLGTTTIYVTHDQTEAMTMGDRIAVMNGGIIQQLATPLELYNTPVNRFVAQFIGSPPMNFIRVQVQDSTTLQHPSFSLTLSSSWQGTLGSRVGQSLDVGIRPEHLNLAPTAPGHIPIVVELVEALGHETYLSFSIQSPGTPIPEVGKLMSARVSPEESVQLGESLSLSVQLDKIHLFEAETGNALVLPKANPAFSSNPL